MSTTHALFQSYTWSIGLPEPFNAPEVKAKRTDVSSRHSSPGGPGAGRVSTLHGPTLKAFMAIHDGLRGESDVAIGFKGGGQQIMVERTSLQLVYVKAFMRNGIHYTLEFKPYNIHQTALRDAFFVFNRQEHPNVEVIDLR